jgi:hypothetical protein
MKETRLSTRRPGCPCAIAGEDSKKVPRVRTRETFATARTRTSYLIFDLETPLCL